MTKPSNQTTAVTGVPRKALYVPIVTKDEKAAVNKTDTMINIRMDDPSNPTIPDKPEAQQLLKIETVVGEI